MILYKTIVEDSGNREEMRIVEKFNSSGGVVNIELWCDCSDKPLDTFDPVKYPKYRHALLAAENAGNDHVGGVDTSPWHLLD